MSQKCQLLFFSIKSMGFKSVSIQIVYVTLKGCLHMLLIPIFVSEETGQTITHSQEGGICRIA